VKNEIWLNAKIINQKVINIVSDEDLKNLTIKNY